MNQLPPEDPLYVKAIWWFTIMFIFLAFIAIPIVINIKNIINN